MLTINPQRDTLGEWKNIPHTQFQGVIFLRGIFFTHIVENKETSTPKRF